MLHPDQPWGKAVVPDLERPVVSRGQAGGTAGAPCLAGDPAPCPSEEECADQAVAHPGIQTPGQPQGYPVLASQYYTPASSL